MDVTTLIALALPHVAPDLLEQLLPHADRKAIPAITAADLRQLTQLQRQLPTKAVAALGAAETRGAFLDQLLTDRRTMVLTALASNPHLDRRQQRQLLRVVAPMGNSNAIAGLLACGLDVCANADVIAEHAHTMFDNMVDETAHQLLSRADSPLTAGLLDSGAVPLQHLASIADRHPQLWPNIVDLTEKHGITIPVKLAAVWCAQQTMIDSGNVALFIRLISRSDSKLPGDIIAHCQVSDSAVAHLISNGKRACRLAARAHISDTSFRLLAEDGGSGVRRMLSCNLNNSAERTAVLCAHARDISELDDGAVAALNADSLDALLSSDLQLAGSAASLLVAERAVRQRSSATLGILLETHAWKAACAWLADSADEQNAAILIGAMRNWPSGSDPLRARQQQLVEAADVAWRRSKAAWAADVLLGVPVRDIGNLYPVRPQLVASWLDSVEQWQLLAGLWDGWQGTLGQLVEVIHRST